MRFIPWKDSFAISIYPGWSHPRERSRYLHTTSIRPNVGPGGASTLDKKISCLS